MERIKQFIRSKIDNSGFTFKVIKKLYHKLSTFKYKIINNKKIRQQNKKFKREIEQAIEKIKKYSNKDYIVFYNPTWLGVANSTKGLFKNIVPLEQVYKKKDSQKIAQIIDIHKIKCVIFSQIVDGWTDIIKQIKIINPDINIKVIWHGNCYEFFSDYTWNLNKEVMQLYNNGEIQSFGFVRSTMKEFFEKVGVKSFYLQNNVHLDAARIKGKSNSNDKKIIGIYNADSRELKNIYTSLAAVKMTKNAMADIVPINKGATEYCKILELEFSSLNHYIDRDKLLTRISKNDINIYPTYTENSPMFPLESFEAGVPCLLGNNNDFFSGTSLEQYVVIKREDDIEYIKNKIEECIDNKEKIMQLYKEWKKEYDIKCNILIDKFVIS